MHMAKVQTCNFMCNSDERQASKTYRFRKPEVIRKSILFDFRCNKPAECVTFDTSARSDRRSLPISLPV